MKIRTNSPEETFDLGYKIAKKIKMPSSILIEGSLGSGKTTLIRGILSYFGYNTVRSPSFLYVYEYNIPGGKIYHIDLYRTEIKDLEEKLNLSELIEENAIFLVEWPEKVKNINFPFPITIKIKIVDETKRELESEIFNSFY
ncbi:MAG: tRNA (adenosine(37)-N6)-threonylcarbamoyltransferase complex ATPase subunit type 1 TsaE [Candidatus Hydrothermales bacterium]